jgi:hypothetical protein
MRRKSFACAAVVLATLCTVSSTSWAWNDTGHMTVALIAYRQLNPAVKTKVDDILSHHPAINDFQNKKPSNFDDMGAWVFMMAATWPDAIRERKNPFHKKFDPDAPLDDPDIPNNLEHRGIHDIEHFVDFPYEDGVPGTDPPRRTILTALPTHVSVLEDHGNPPSDRAVALSWLLHLFGDIHQPLHCTTRFTPQFPKGDRGGNSFLISTGGRPLPLHTFWDDLLGTSKSPRTITFIADRVINAPGLGRDDLSELSHTQFKAWSAESFEDAKAFAYLDGDLPGAPAPPKRTDPLPDDVEPVPSGYQNNARELAQKRIALAGYRLADQLNRSLVSR